MRFRKLIPPIMASKRFGVVLLRRSIVLMIAFGGLSTLFLGIGRELVGFGFGGAYNGQGGDGAFYLGMLLFYVGGFPGFLCCSYHHYHGGFDPFITISIGGWAFLGFLVALVWTLLSVRRHQRLSGEGGVPIPSHAEGWFRRKQLVGILALLILIGLPGTYCVRLRIQEVRMASAMDRDDGPAVLELAQSFPCPVSADGFRYRTPLHWAAERGEVELTGVLLSKGAEVDARDSVGVTPLDLASIAGHKKVAELLVAKGADVNTRTDGGWTALHGAASNGRAEVAEFLIAKGADIKAKDSLGETSLYAAAAGGHKDVVALLVAEGADVNGQGTGWATPLHAAAWGGHKETVEWLLAHGADISARDGQKKTPLDLAVSQFHKDIADILRRAGAKE